MMSARKFPNFHKQGGRRNFYPVVTISILFGAALIISSVFTEKKNILDWLICLAAPVLGIVSIILAFVVFKEGRAVRREKTAWLRTSREAQATILERKEEATEDRDEGLTTKWSLGLSPIPAQLEGQPCESQVWAGVSKSQYRKYAWRSSLRITYSSEDPFTFLLEDEI